MFASIKLTETHQKKLILILFIAIPILYHAFAYIGHYGYDDMQYAKLANDIIHSKADYNDHFFYRWTVLFSTALSYKIFGINDLASSLPSMTINIMIILLIYTILKRKNPYVLFLGLSIYTLNNATIFWSDKLMPDTYVAFFSFLALTSIYMYKFLYGNKAFIYAFLFSASVFLGFLSKGTIIFILPLIIILLFLDILKGNHLKFWLYALMFLAGFSIVYFSILKIQTGDFLIRFKAISQNSYINLFSYDREPVALVIKRITYELFLAFIKQNMFLGIILLLSIYCSKDSKKYFNPDKEETFFVFSSLILVISSNFMSISYSHYVPMGTDSRHYLFLIPVFAVAFAPLLYEFVKNKRYKYHLIFITGATAFIAYINNYKAFGNLYLPMFILFLIYTILPTTNFSKRLFAIAFVIILGISPYKMFLYAQNNVRYHKQREIIKKYVINGNHKFIVTDPVLKRLGQYYNSFNDNLVFYDFNDVPVLTHKKNILLVKNNYTMILSKIQKEDLPFYARIISDHYKKIYENSNIGIAIYEISEMPDIDTIMQTCNGFETEKLENWNYKIANLEDSIVKSGKYAYPVNEYSATFGLSGKKFISEVNNLWINIKAYCWISEFSKIKLVVEIRNNKNKIIYWKGTDISKYIKSYTNWWKTDITQHIEFEDTLVKNAKALKIYFWNRDKKQMYIDDFCITAFKTK